MHVPMIADSCHKSHNKSDKYKYPTMHHSVTEMCMHVHISITKWCIVGYVTAVLCDFCNMSYDI